MATCKRIANRSIGGRESELREGCGEREEVERKGAGEREVEREVDRKRGR